MTKMKKDTKGQTMVCKTQHT